MKEKQKSTRNKANEILLDRENEQMKPFETSGKVKLARMIKDLEYKGKQREAMAIYEQSKRGVWKTHMDHRKPLEDNARIFAGLKYSIQLKTDERTMFNHKLAYWQVREMELINEESRLDNRQVLLTIAGKLGKKRLSRE